MTPARLPIHPRGIPETLTDAELATAPRMTLAQRQDHHRWRSQFVQGRPKATEHYSVEQIEVMGLVGPYRVRQSRAKASP